MESNPLLRVSSDEIINSQRETKETLFIIQFPKLNFQPDPNGLPLLMQVICGKEVSVIQPTGIWRINYFPVCTDGY